mgnify:FL=1
MRLRRLKAQLMEAEAHKGLERLLTPLVDALRRRTLVEGWAARSASAVRDVNSILKKAGLGQDAIHAQTFSLKLDTFERIDRMIMQTEARRNASLREIDRHRDVLAQRLRETSKEIVDAEFAEIAPQNGAGA